MNRTLFAASLCFVIGSAALLAPAGEKSKKHMPTAEEAKLTELTNQERKKKDLKPLRVNPLLSKLARDHAENMARQGKMEHTLDGKSPFDRMKEAGYQFTKAGENIAASERGATLEGIIRNWMESEGHRANILMTDYREIGIGIARDKKGEVYFTQVFGNPRK